MSKQNKENTQSFMNNVTIILISQVLVKVLGMVYRIVITNIDGFGDEGLGFYNVGFQIYYNQAYSGIGNDVPDTPF